MLPLSVAAVAELLNYKISDDQAGSQLIFGASVNSKKVNKRDLFFALPGEKVDGHSFLKEAFENGATAAVVSKEYSGNNFGLVLIKVVDVLKALQSLAQWYLHLYKPKIVAITGSLGKTTTKDFTTTLLQSFCTVGSTPGNANSRIGVPLSILSMDSDCDVLVIEMGMSAKGDLRSLVNIVPPDIAVITTVAYVHACYFDSLEDIAAAKGEIFLHPQTRVGIVNESMPFASNVSQIGPCQKRTFSSTNEDAEYYIRKEGAFVEIYFQKEKRMSIPWNILGDHNLQNYLAAVVVARECKMSFEEIALASKNLKLPSNRLQRIEKSGITFINDAYNANENSMCAALSSMPLPLPGKKKIAVLGDMKELGKFSKDAHRGVGNHALLHVDELLCLGEGCKEILDCWVKAKKPVFLAQDKNELLIKLKASIEPGDVVLIKGSRSHALDSILDEI